MIILGVIITLTFGTLYHYFSNTENAILDKALIHSPSFGLLCSAGLMTSIAISASTFLMPLFFQLGLGMTPLTSGTLLMVFGVGVLLGRAINPFGIEFLGANVGYWRFNR